MGSINPTGMNSTGQFVIGNEADSLVTPTTGQFSSQAYDVYSAGTAYSLTATPAALAFGTTSPTITIAVAGTYRIRTWMNLTYNGATLLASRTASAKLRRTNNTAADIANGSASISTAVTTVLTSSFTNSAPTIMLPEVLYTAQAGDVVSIFGSISVVPTLGSVDVTSAGIHAQRVA